MKKLLIIFKDHRLLKLSFILLTVYLLFDELILFFSTKPTLTTQVQTSLQTNQFPEALICSSPAFDQEKLISMGYEHSHDYILGILDGEFLHGWSGNQSDVSIEKILQDISVMKTEEDCPSAKVKFEEKGKIIKSKLSLILTRPMYPHGRCCKIKLPNRGPSSVLHQIYFRIFLSKYTNKKIKRFKMFLSDPVTASPFQDNKMVGGSLQTESISLGPKGDIGYTIYKVKVHEEIQLEDNPSYRCRSYNSAGQFDSCLEQEFTRQSLSLLQCVPPWLTENQTRWCRNKINVSSQKSEEIKFFLEKLSFGKAQIGDCLSPCRTTWYEVNIYPYGSPCNALLRGILD